MKKKYHVDTVCPRCGKNHNDVSANRKMSVPYTGAVKPRFYCKKCIDNMQSMEWSQQDLKGTKKGKTTLLGLSVTRGVDAVTKAKNDLIIELMGREFRKDWGIKAPPWQWYVKG